jgi:hypothetical protein
LKGKNNFLDDNSEMSLFFRFGMDSSVTISVFKHYIFVNICTNIRDIWLNNTENSWGLCSKYDGRLAQNLMSLLKCLLIPTELNCWESSLAFMFFILCIHVLPPPRHCIQHTVQSVSSFIHIYTCSHTPNIYIQHSCTHQSLMKDFGSNRNAFQGENKWFI